MFGRGQMELRSFVGSSGGYLGALWLYDSACADARVVWHVCTVGEEFEHKILSNEAENPKFKFLVPGTPFHAYYKGQIERIRNPDASEEKSEKQIAGVAGETRPVSAAGAVEAGAEKKKFVPPVTAVTSGSGGGKEGKKDAAAQGRPLGEQYTIHAPDGISTADFELMKVTAQFVARNGKAFMTSLASKEESNPQFAFLMSTHSLHKFFMTMCAAYSRVLMPPDNLLIMLKKDSLSKMPCLERAIRRLEYERERDREEDEKRRQEEKEREAMLSTDWQDFVVVETIEFEMGEEGGLPMPMTLKDAMRMAREMRMEAGKAKEAERLLDEEDARLIEEGRLAAGVPSTTARQTEVEVLGDGEETIRVVKNYKRRKQGGLDYDPTKYVVSPLTGELVEINAMAEHMRVSLIDPKWKTQRDAMLAKMKGSAKASDDEISRNLSMLAKNRPDVFGDQDTLLAALEKEQKGGNEAPDTKRQKT